MINKIKINLCSFASPDLARSALRFTKQAQKINLYKKIKIYSVDDLRDKEKKFLNQLLKKGKIRGYGYWFWKPLIIKHFLLSLKEDEILNYVDVGSHINLDGYNRLNYYINLVKKSKKGILAFQFNKLKKKFFIFPKRYEYMYTKSDLLDYFKVLNNKKITHTPQYESGCIFLKKNKYTLRLLDEWAKVYKDNFSLADDSKSRIKNLKGFIENRHDQSIFSILCKKYKVKTLSAFEIDWAMFKKQRTWKHNMNCPILLKRDLKYNFLKRFLNRQKKTFRRITKKFNKS
ncbi:hypothetical protein OAC14_00065 [Candidatus Pelagibacter sp.]|nr:hypothetical protein [Candidatus Pelagibacter sp.]